MTHILHSNERTDWQTPPEVLDRVRRVGPIALDPASAPRNPTRAAAYFARTEGAPGWRGPCGLVGSWERAGLAFVNPPYGRHLSGAIDPAAEVRKKGQRVGTGTGWAKRIAQDRGEWIALVPNRTETEWWGSLFYASTLLQFPDHRIPFVNPDTGALGDAPNHGSTIFYHGPNARAFALAFDGFGITLQGGTR